MSLIVKEIRLGSSLGKQWVKDLAQFAAVVRVQSLAWDPPHDAIAGKKKKVTKFFNQIFKLVSSEFALDKEYEI